MGLCLLNPLASLLLAPQHTMLHVIGGPGGIVVVPLTTAIFLMCYSMNVKAERMRTALKSISVLSLDMYLFSYIFDATFYPLLMSHFPILGDSFAILFVAAVPLVFLSSYGAAYVKSKIIKTYK